MINVYLVKELDLGMICSKEIIEDYMDYYKLLECSTFDVVRVTYKGEELSLFVDDEGMMKPYNYGRMVAGYPAPLFGHIVVTGGVDDRGETLSVPESVTLMELKNLIGEVEFITRGE